jgi:hypothetical protein
MRFNAYKKAVEGFPGHEVVNHSAGEYGRGDAYTKTVESYFSLLKRGVMGPFITSPRSIWGGTAMSFRFGRATGR